MINKNELLQWLNNQINQSKHNMNEHKLSFDDSKETKEIGKLEAYREVIEFINKNKH